MLDHFVAAIAAHAAVDGLKLAFDYVARKRPDLASAAAKAEAAEDIGEVDRIFQEAIGVIKAGAANGELSISRATLSALNGIKVDHEHGRVNIGGVTLSAKVLVTGGGATATGQTTIGGNTALRSQGTAIEVGEGASIVMTGGARIVQN